MGSKLEELLVEIRGCRECEHSIEPRPVVTAHDSSRVLIIGQAPGIRVHKSGVPWDDPSGKRLREWMGISSEDFYDTSKVALVPMGFCYPGTGSSGDLPPRKECVELWHDRLLTLLPNVKLTLLLGQYSQKYKLGKQRESNLTGTVQAWRNFRPRVIPLPHPSPRNNRWLKNNPWFDEELLPYLKRRVKAILKPVV